MTVIEQFAVIAEHATSEELIRFASAAMREMTWDSVSDVVCGIWRKRGGEEFECLCYECALRGVDHTA